LPDTGGQITAKNIQQKTASKKQRETANNINIGYSRDFLTINKIDSLYKHICGTMVRQ